MLNAVAPNWDYGDVDKEGEATPLSQADEGDGPRRGELRRSEGPSAARSFFAGFIGFAAGAAVAISIFAAGFFAFWMLIHRHT